MVTIKLQDRQHFVSAQVGASNPTISSRKDGRQAENVETRWATFAVIFCGLFRFMFVSQSSLTCNIWPIICPPLKAADGSSSILALRNRGFGFALSRKSDPQWPKLQIEERSNEGKTAI